MTGHGRDIEFLTLPINKRKEFCYEQDEFEHSLPVYYADCFLVLSPLVAERLEIMSSSPKPRKRFPLILLCLVLLFGTLLLWILNLENIVSGPWAAILSALYTIVSILVAFLQWLMPRPHSPGLPSSSMRGQVTLFNSPSSLGVSKRRGALIVKTRKNVLGTTIHLCSGFTSTPFTTEIAANVSRYKSEEGIVFGALFPALEPGNYTVFLQTSPLSAFVTIRAGKIADVDWHCRDIKRHQKGGKFVSLLF